MISAYLREGEDQSTWKKETWKCYFNEKRQEINDLSINATVLAQRVFSQEVKKLQVEQFKPFEQVTLEPLSETVLVSSEVITCQRNRKLLLHHKKSQATLAVSISHL
ncbi:hypothetical protein BT93_H2014 [Corymbia citriodora subsp. variegata]|nr:hypothetical protein BT93_H2014 [Corymbia citriodora subsp. variegata]